eukprot:UN08437
MGDSDELSLNNGELAKGQVVPSKKRQLQAEQIDQQSSTNSKILPSTQPTIFC